MPTPNFSQIGLHLAKLWVSKVQETLKKKRKNPQKYKLLLNYLTERHQILCEHYWGFAWPPHQILAQSINIEQSYGLSKSRYTPKNEKNEHFFFYKMKTGGK